MHSLRSIKRSHLSEGIASSRDDLLAAFALVSRRYCDSGLLNLEPSAIAYQPAFGLSTSRTIVVKHTSSSVVGTVTIVGDHDGCLQIEQTFPESVELLRARGRKIAEFTHLAIETHKTSAEKLQPFLALTRFAFQYAQHQGYDDLVLGVHPRHVRFYKRWFGTIELGAPRTHRFVQDLPAVACRIDMHTLERRVRPKTFRYYTTPPYPTREFQKPSISPDDHLYLMARSQTVTGIQNDTAAADPSRRAA